MESGQLGHDCNYIARADRAGRNHAGIEATHAPTRGAGVALFDARVEDLVFEGLAVDVELPARTARLGDLEHGSSGADLVANADIADGEAASSEVFAERS